jgi:hypothetical protein
MVVKRARPIAAHSHMPPVRSGHCGDGCSAASHVCYGCGAAALGPAGAAAWRQSRRRRACWPPHTSGSVAAWRASQCALKRRVLRAVTVLHGPARFCTLVKVLSGTGPPAHWAVALSPARPLRAAGQCSGRTLPLERCLVLCGRCMPAAARRVRDRRQYRAAHSLSPWPWTLKLIKDIFSELKQL